ncbi:MAG: hypothetical protein AAF495_25370 [Pseudomonadota bacterium]
MQDEDAPSDGTEALIESISDLVPDGMPPIVKKRFWNTVGSLVAGTLDIPLAYLETKSHSIRHKQKVRSMIEEGTAAIALRQIASDPNLRRRAMDYHAGEIVNRQHNREEVLRRAAIELSASDMIEKKSEKENDG